MKKNLPKYPKCTLNAKPTTTPRDSYLQINKYITEIILTEVYLQLSNYHNHNYEKAKENLRFKKRNPRVSRLDFSSWSIGRKPFCHFFVSFSSHSDKKKNIEQVINVDEHYEREKLLYYLHPRAGTSPRHNFAHYVPLHNREGIIREANRADVISARIQSKASFFFLPSSWRRWKKKHEEKPKRAETFCRDGRRKHIM